MGQPHGSCNVRTSGTILVKRNSAKGHEEIVVHTEWDGCTEDDIKLMASLYVQNCVEWQLRLNETKLPEQVVVKASDYLHKPKYEKKELNIPAAWKAPPESKAAKAFKDAVKGLSIEDIRLLLGGHHEAED